LRRSKDILRFDAAEARRRLRWNECQVKWLDRLERQERHLLTSVPGFPLDCKAIKAALDQARDAWQPEDPPVDWTPHPSDVELLPFDVILTANNGVVRERRYRAREAHPDTGERIPEGQYVDKAVDLGVAYARALRDQALAEASPSRSRATRSRPARAASPTSRSATSSGRPRRCRRGCSGVTLVTTAQQSRARWGRLVRGMTEWDDADSARIASPSSSARSPAQATNRKRDQRAYRATEPSAARR